VQATQLSKVYGGAEVPNGNALLGVRPEDLLAREDGAPLGIVTLDVVEHMGHETIAHFTLAGSDHVARLPADAAVVPGDQLPLSIRPGAFHVFSGDDGRRLN
jgi:multiple sugar transport system ATP-binding protein